LVWRDIVIRNRRAIALLVCLLLLAGVPAAALSYYPPLPGGPVGLLRPMIFQQFELGEGENFGTAKMWLDGTEVPASRDPVAGTVFYVPPAPLAQGHTRSGSRYR